VKRTLKRELKLLEIIKREANEYFKRKKVTEELKKIEFINKSFKTLYIFYFFQLFISFFLKWLI